MGACLGLDTSNYTTSCALLLPGGQLMQQRQLLPVAQGQRGLRQSEALFLHNRQLPALLEELFAQGPRPALSAVGFSKAPRDEEGSYMPCFLAGAMMARGLAAATGAALHPFSHQAGHVAAALYSAGCLGWLEGEFVALHISGGTTECLAARGDRDSVLALRAVGATADLNAGQVVDRIGVAMGFPFPAGRFLDELALSSQREGAPSVPFRQGRPCFSGLENQCRAMLEKGAPREDVAWYCLTAIQNTVWAMACRAREETGASRVIFSGGVMASRLIRRALEGRADTAFSQPALSSDNAVGIAVLTALKEGML